MYIVVGRVRTVYGVKGWLKVQPYTDPEDNLFAHTQWCLSAVPDATEQAQDFATLPVSDWKFNGKDWLVRFDGFEDRDSAATLRQRFIYLPKTAMPALAEDEVYLHQLQGMSVYQSAKSLVDGEEAGGDAAFASAKHVGVISHILETGATDVVVLEAGEGETLMLPYVLGHSVFEVDVDNNRMLIDWVFD